MKRSKSKTGLAVLVLVSLLRPGLAETKQDGPIKTAWDDGIYLFTSPARITRDDVPILLGVTGSIAGLSLLDATVRNHLVDWKETASAKELRHWGDHGQFAGPVIGTVFAIHGWATKNPTSQETALLAYESFVWSGALSGVFKYVVGRNRPSNTDDPYEFHFGRANASFPSGHTTVAFSAATVFAEQYPHWYVVVPSYAAATAVGFSRMYSNQHWLSDVAAGAVLGFTVSHTLRNRHRRNNKSDWSFQLDPTGLRLTKAF